MKIFHLISGGETGGSRKHVITLLSQFPKGEATLGVFQEGALSAEAEEAGIDVIIFKQASRYDLSVLNKVVSYIKDGGFEILHTHGPRSNLFGLYIASRSNVKWLTTVHSDPALDFMKSGVKGSVFTKLHLLALKRMDHYFAVSETFKQNLVKMGINAGKITTVYNGIDFTEQKVHPADREGLGAAESGFVMAMVARLHPVKGHELVLKALKNLNKEDAVLLLVGDGPTREELIQTAEALGISSQVRFLGFRDDVDAIYAASNVGLLASYSESFPLALLEAANQHVPLISTDVGGVKELIEDGKTGWIVPPGEATAIEEAFSKAYSAWESGELKAMGDRLYEHASARFSLLQLYKDTKETYIKVKEEII